MSNNPHTPDFNPWSTGEEHSNASNPPASSGTNPYANPNTTASGASNTYSPPSGPPPNYSGGTKPVAGVGGQSQPDYNYDPFSQGQQTGSTNPFAQPSHESSGPGSHSNNPYVSNTGADASPPSTNPYAHPPANTHSPFSTPFPAETPSTRDAPALPPRRAETFDLPPDTNRAEQVEALQTYEAAKAAERAEQGGGTGQSQQDRDVETLQKEFPGMDGSLIAAIYGDSGSLSATREMLQALGTD